MRQYDEFSSKIAPKMACSASPFEGMGIKSVSLVATAHLSVIDRPNVNHCFAPFQFVAVALHGEVVPAVYPHWSAIAFAIPL